MYTLVYGYAMSSYQDSRMPGGVGRGYLKRQEAAARSKARAERLADEMRTWKTEDLVALVMQGEAGGDYPKRTAAYNELKARRSK